MNDIELAKSGLPGVGHATLAVPKLGWRAEGIAIWPGVESNQVGIRRWFGSNDIQKAEFACTTCGHGSQPWSAWVTLARRILAAEEAMSRTDIKTGEKS